MTKTALRALTMAVLSAAVALSTVSPALADDAAGPCLPGQDIATPECPNPWPDTTNVTVCMAEPWRCNVEPEIVQEQLPEESTGGYRCPDPADTVPCDTTDDPGAAPAAVDAEQPAGQPVDTGAQITQRAPSAPSAHTAQSAQSAGLPSWVIMDKIMEILRAVIAAITGQPVVG